MTYSAVNGIRPLRGDHQVPRIWFMAPTHRDGHIGFMVKVITKPAQLWNRWRRRGGSIFAVGFLNLRAHFLQALALVHHFHHVTRDAYADASSKAHAIEFQFFAG